MPYILQASLTFINNTAGMDGAAIYATSIARCTYTSTNVTSTGTTPYENSIFQVSPLFSFTGNTLSAAVKRNVTTLATAPSQLRVTPPVIIYNLHYRAWFFLQCILQYDFFNQTFTAAPGETVVFLVKAMDQAGNPVEAIWSVTEKSESEEESTIIIDVNIK